MDNGPSLKIKAKPTRGEGEAHINENNPMIGEEVKIDLSEAKKLDEGNNNS